MNNRENRNRRDNSRRDNRIRKRNTSDIRSRKRKRKNRRKNSRIFQILIVLLITIASIFVLRYFSKKEDNNKDKEIQETQEESLVETEEEIELSEKIRRLNEALDNKYGDLTNRLNLYLVNNNIEKDDVKLIFKDINDEENIVRINSDKLVPMRNYNIFIISMLAEDLDRENKLNIKENIDRTELPEENQDISYESLIEKMILKGDSDMINSLIKKVEDSSGKAWRELANEYYNTDLNEDNEMTFDSIVNVLNRLVEKNENGYLYNRTFNAMIKNAETKDSIAGMNAKYFIGYIAGSEYEYNIEIVFSIGKNPFIYAIYTPYSENNVRVDLRNIINKWLGEYYLND